MSRLFAVEVVEPPDAAAPDSETLRERRLAIEELIEENRFAPTDARAPHGPYRLRLSLADGRLAFSLETESGAAAGEVHLSLTPFRQVLRDYFQIVAAYHAGVRSLPPAKLEAIDMGRRGIHNEGARLLGERLAGKIDTDEATTRRLFTLICAVVRDI
mgnify:CR=1 FL=1